MSLRAAVRKRCHRCSAPKPETGEVHIDAQRCPMCGGRAFFHGPRMTRTLWPPLPEGNGEDTYDPETGVDDPAAWDREVSKITEPRWRR